MDGDRRYYAFFCGSFCGMSRIDDESAVLEHPTSDAGADASSECACVFVRSLDSVDACDGFENCGGVLRPTPQTYVPRKRFDDFEMRPFDAKSIDGFGDETLEVRQLVTFRAYDFDRLRWFRLDNSAR